MQKYNTNDMLEVWSTGSSLSSQDPFPSTPDDPENTEDLINQGATDMTTNVPGPDGHDINRAINQKLKVSEAELPPEEKIPTKPPQPNEPMVPPDMQSPPGTMPPMNDPSMANQDPGMTGMGMGMSGPTSTFDVGRVYELKKIYSRLVSMQSYLAGTTDPNLIKLRNYISGTMDLFRTLISNVALYKDKLDEIIVVFYKVIDNVYEILSKYYKDKDSGKMVQAVEHVQKRSVK